MATVTIHRTMLDVAIAPILPEDPRAVAEITTSGTSAVSTITIQPGEIAYIKASGGAVWVRLGPEPNLVAAANTGWKLLDGDYEFLRNTTDTPLLVAAIDA